MFCDCAALCCIMTDKLTCYLVIQQQLFIFFLKIYHVGFAAYELRVLQKNMKNLVFKIETICTIREGQSYGDSVHCLI